MSEFRIKVKGIVEYEGRYLLMKKWYDDNITAPYKWEFADAEVKFGNSPENTVLDAVKDKAGLDVILDKILYTWSYIVGEIQYLGIAYLCRAEEDIVVLSEELLEYVWVKPEEFTNYIDNNMVLHDIKILTNNKSESEETDDNID